MPLFERIESDDFAELQQSRHIIDAMQRKLDELEKINMDLEFRLEDQAKLCMELEHECTQINRTWHDRCATMEKEIEEWRKKFHIEEKKGARLREQISRTERELYGILQRKYELMRVPGGNVKTNSNKKDEEIGSLGLPRSESSNENIALSHPQVWNIIRIA
jgi:predicted RNase H-like nuclease (RuvC/YqgF family)